VPHPVSVIPVDGGITANTGQFTPRRRADDPVHEHSEVHL